MKQLCRCGGKIVENKELVQKSGVPANPSDKLEERSRSWQCNKCLDIFLPTSEEETSLLPEAA